jgi:hypothetical protein
MKKNFISILVAFSFLSLVPGCNMSDTQMTAIAKQSGMIAAISWITTDNPQEEVKAQVRTIVATIEEKSNLVVQGQSYAATLSSILEPIIIEKIPAQYQGVVKLGTTALLSGIDLLFAMYPDVAKKEDVVISLIHEFCLGATQGLSLTADSAIMKAIEPGMQNRAMISKSLSLYKVD